MISRIFSSLPSFKELKFNTGLNILLAKKEETSTIRQTRNRAGKTSMIEIVHFILGSDTGVDSLFRVKEIINESFGMEFDLNCENITVKRSGITKSKINITNSSILRGRTNISNSEWIELLSRYMFGITKDREDLNRYPSFRSLFAYFVRRQNNGAFFVPEKQSNMQQISDYQKSLLFLLGLDWKIASDWQIVRDKEKTLAELKKAGKSGTFGTIIGKSSDLRTQLLIAESKLQEINSQLASFHVLSQYRELEEEADLLTNTINELANNNIIDLALVRDLKESLEIESPPSVEDLTILYKEAGVLLPNNATKTYEDVRSFHESIIKNRKSYLEEELTSAQKRIDFRENEKLRLEKNRTEIMQILNSHGALDQFSKLQGKAGRLEADVESLRKKFETSELLESTKNELEIERNHLNLRLRRNFTEQTNQLSEAILAFEEISNRLYESAGSMTIDETSNGPIFKFPMQGSRSKGITNMQIYCFDMMLMKLCAKRGIGPGFLIHDSHLFDGVDGRQVISALKAGSQIAEEMGFQYIVTLNEDDAFKEKIENFDIKQYILPVELTDATEDGGLFGIRFG